MRDFICCGIAPSDLDVYYDGMENASVATGALMRCFPGSQWVWDDKNGVSGKLQVGKHQIEMDFVNPMAEDILQNVDFDVNTLIISRDGIAKRHPLGNRPIPLIIGNTRLKRCAIWDFRVVVTDKNGRIVVDRVRYMLTKRLPKMILTKHFYVANFDDWLSKIMTHLKSLDDSNKLLQQAYFMAEENTKNRRKSQSR